jgi:hypothetical protein
MLLEINDNTYIQGLKPVYNQNVAAGRHGQEGIGLSYKVSQLTTKERKRKYEQR